MINKRLLKFDEVRVLGNDGSQLGVMNTRDAIAAAEQQELDLVLVAPNAKPVVTKICDYGKHKYEQSKAKKDQKKKTLDVKVVKLRPGTQEHDLNVLIKFATKFLGEGHKVRVVCMFRPRELAHPEIGKEKLLWIAEQLADLGKMDRDPIRNGREMAMILAPGAGKKQDGKAEDKQDGGEEI